MVDRRDKIMVFLWISLLVLFPGCAGLMGGWGSVPITPGPNPEVNYAPVNESDRPRLVKYRDSSGILSGSPEGNRKWAYARMHDSCSGDYKILREYPHSEGDADSIRNFIYIEYQCVKAKEEPK